VCWCDEAGQRIDYRARNCVARSRLNSEEAWGRNSMISAATSSSKGLNFDGLGIEEVVAPRL
jgi:hypothetical protein